MEKTVKLSSSEPQAALRPEDFPVGSRLSRVAVRAMLEAKQAGGIELHVEIVGYGPDPKCDCTSCRRKWSKVTAEERAAVLAEFENFMFRACGCTAVQAAPKQRQERQAVDAADRHTRVNGANAVGYLDGQGYASSTDETARRRFPLTRTGRAMAFLRGGGSL